MNPTLPAARHRTPDAPRARAAAGTARQPTRARRVARPATGTNAVSRPIFRHHLAGVSCSLAVLGALGVIGPAAAQVAPLPNAVPVLRGVVSGQAVVNAPVSTGAGRLLTIDQASQRAILDWRSFDIGSASEVRFNQPSSQASALNRIYSSDPTIIQGKLSANGQVLLINQNGILFDRGSQVNVQSLVASTLNITNERFNSGALTTGGLASPAFAGGYDDTGATLPTRPDGRTPGAIDVGTLGPATSPAAILSARTGGTILLFAPRIENNAGVITAPDGQVILAAGARAYLAFPDATDTTLRGFRVEVEASPTEPLNLTNVIRNAGTITADRGNVTLAGLAINQEGRVSATTAIQANGSIFLQARSAVAPNSATNVDAGTVARTGSVTLAAGSRTEVLPDSADKATLPQSQSFTDRRGVISVDAQTIASAGAVQATGGVVNLTARGLQDPTAARIYLDAGSQTSAAGAVAEVPFANNLATFKVTSNELKDSPNQKDGILKGQTVTVDLRRGSALLDVSGYQAAQARTVTEKAATGGDLNLNSTGSLIQRAGASLDASGGAWKVAPGTAAVSLLFGADGRSYSITTAPEAQKYTALLDTFTRTDARWGQTQVFSGLAYGIGTAEPATVQGRPGGNINLNAAAGLVLDGRIDAGVTIGDGQLAAAPRAGKVTIGGFNAIENQFIEGQRIGNVALTQTARDTLGADFTAATALTALRQQQTSLAVDQLFAPSLAGAAGGGVAVVQRAPDTVEINANGQVTLNAETRAVAAPGSTLLVRAPKIEVAGQLALPSGSVTLQPVATVNPISPDLSPGNNSVVVRNGARIDTRGVWVNNATVDGSSLGLPLPTGRLTAGVDANGNAITTTASMVNGGRIAVNTTADRQSTTVLEAGASLDVGGGAVLGSGRRVTTSGSGGTMSLATGIGPTPNADWLQAELSGASPGTGGRLTLTAPRVVIDGPDTVGTLPASTTRLRPGFFTDPGFSSVTVNTVQGVSVNNDATLVLRQKSRVIDVETAATLPTGGDLRLATSLETLPDAQRAPTSLALNAANTSATSGGARVTVGPQALIQADPGASVSLSAQDGLVMNGRIVAPSGTVSLTLNAPAETANAPLTLGEGARVDVSGSFVARPNAEQLTQGTVRAAGSITIAAANAGVTLAPGAQLELRGIRQTLEARAADGSPAVVRQDVDGNAGTLIVRSQGKALLQGRIDARAASPTSAGGSLALELLGRDIEPEVAAERRIVVSQAPLDEAAVAQGAAGAVTAAVSATALAQQGFDKIRLQAENRIELRGDQTLAFQRGVRLDSPLLEVTENGKVNLQGTNVALGQSLGPRPAGIAPGQPAAINQLDPTPALATQAGAGSLQVQAGTVDVYGSVTVNGVSELRLGAQGDVRLTGRTVIDPSSPSDGSFGKQVGALTSAGNVTINATQVVPTTRTDFTLGVVQRTPGQPDTPVPGGFVVIGSNGQTPGLAYSANGKLTVNADRIVQGGAIQAPFGEINLNAQQRLELSPGSVTSVSGADVVVPYGTTLAGQSWRYQDSVGGSLNALTSRSADAKRIALNAATVEVQTGARVDLSGGGEVQAAEFVPGVGGSRNVLLQPDTFAIIPKARLTSMPVDTDTASRQDPGFGLQSARADTAVYDQIRIGAGAAVPAGDYVLLPGRYALLPDAFLVQLLTANTYANLAPGQTVTLVNGQTVVAGQRIAGGTNVRESRTVGVVVQPGSAVSRQSDFTISTSRYFAELADAQRADAPRLPLDAGRLTVTGASQLALDGTVNAAPGSRTTVNPLDGSTTTTRGQQAEVDIAADRIAIVDRRGAAALVDPAALQLEGTALSRLGASVLVGGVRSLASDGSTRIATTASEIVVANTAAGALRSPELMLSANDRVEVQAGAVLSGTATESGRPASAARIITADAGGALLRVSDGGQATVLRGPAIDTSRGDVTVAAGASLSAAGSLLLDGTRSTQSQGTLQVDRGGDVSLASSVVALGQTAGLSAQLNPPAGLILSNDDLLRLGQASQLSIKAYQGIDLVGAAQVGSAALGQLTLDAPALRAQAGGSLPTTAAPEATLSASTVRLTNTGSAPGSAAVGSAGQLTVQAQSIQIGPGSQEVSGFAGVALRAQKGVLVQGSGEFNATSDLTVSTPVLQAASRADQRISASDRRDPLAIVDRALRVEAAAGNTSAAAESNAAGGRLALQGSSVSVDTAVQARSGVIGVTASSLGGVTLGARGALDASGTTARFEGRDVPSDGGRIAIQTPGAVQLASGSRVSVAGAPSASAGSLDVRAGSLEVAGTLQGQAPASAAPTASSVGSTASVPSVLATPGLQRAGGRVRLDLDQTGNFSEIGRALGAGGFDASVAVRARTGDLVVAAADSIRAQRIDLSADAGRVVVAGTLDASSARGGGKIELNATSGVALTAGSVLTAAGTGSAAVESNGGQVRLGSSAGAITLEPTATVDLRPGAVGRAGSVTFSVARDAQGGVAPTALSGTVLGHRAGNVASGPATAVLEAQSTVTVAGTLTAAAIAGLAADHAAFVASGAGGDRFTSLQGDAPGQGPATQVRGATEVRASGDLTVSAPIALVGTQWLAGDKPGTLSLRAGGNLTVANAVGFANDNLVAGASWNLRAVGGADLSAANPLTTQAVDATGTTGNVQVSGTAGRLRTGTGSIEVAAATDFKLITPRNTVTTVGRPGAADTAVGGNNRWTEQGGDISVTAGRDAVGPLDNQAVTEWLRRPRNVGQVASPAEWWVFRNNFQQGLGTLAGGDVTVDAGRDVLTLSAMLPTVGRNTSPAGSTPVRDVQGGGDLQVRAGGDIAGGSYLVSRGQGRLDAAGNIGQSASLGSSPVQLYLMGESSGTVPEGATLAATAGGAVAIQSVNNPTAIFQDRSSGSGPSFGAGPTSVSTFFTYTPTTAVALLAKGGDVALDTQRAPARGLANPSLNDNTEVGTLPPVLSAVALDGSVRVNPAGPTRTAALYPSVQGALTLLADRSVLDPNLSVSDRTLDSVRTSANPFGANANLAGADVLPAPGATRIVQRVSPVTGGYAFDVQARAGDVGTSTVNAAVLSLPAASRILGGRDVSNVTLLLQNLDPADLTLVRAQNGDVKPLGLQIGGPGTLLLQAGRNIDVADGKVFAGQPSRDLGGIVATGSNTNFSLRNGDAARMVIVAGVKGPVDLSKLKSTYDALVGLNTSSDQVLGFFRALNGDPDRAAVEAAESVDALVARDRSYEPFAALVRRYPSLLTVYQETARKGTLPLGTRPEARQANELYALLNQETDTQRILGAGSVADLVQGTAGGQAYSRFSQLDRDFPRVFADYRDRRSRGARPEGLTPILFSDVLAGVTAGPADPATWAAGSLFTFQSSIQSYGNSRAPTQDCVGQCPGQGDIEIFAPRGGVVAGLTTPPGNTTIGVVTNAGGAIRSVVGNNFDINQGKVLTAQGGDILLYSSGGSIDAGRGARTSISTPPPTRTPITVDGVVVGFLFTVPAGASGSGIQTLTSDPDGLGPLEAARAGSIFLFAPAGTIDAGEAGIRSSGNLVINAQTVLNTSNISVAGSSAGVPKVEAGSLASSLATTSAPTTGASKAAEEAAAAAGAAAREAAAKPPPKPTILSVDVLGFGDRNCREDDKNCFVK